MATLTAIGAVAFLARALGFPIRMPGHRGLAAMVVIGVAIFYSERYRPQLVSTVAGPLLLLALMLLGFWLMLFGPSKRGAWKACDACDIRHRQAECPGCGRGAD